VIRQDMPPRRIVQAPSSPLAWLVWALVGNDDDGLHGDERWRAGRTPSLWLAVQWWFRNPFHNLFFYVIGVAHKQRTVYSTREWSAPGWTFHITRAGWLPLPFVCFRGRPNFYAGWRPTGAFGLKFNFSRS
jgi:hypothetical protein